MKVNKMNTLQILSFAAALGISITFNTGVIPAQAATLTADEIKILLIGKTMKYWGKSKGVQKWTRTGTSWTDEKWGPGKNKWWLKGNKYCFKSEAGKEQCRSWKSLGNNIYSTTGSGYKWSPL